MLMSGVLGGKRPIWKPAGHPITTQAGNEILEGLDHVSKARRLSLGPIGSVVSEVDYVPCNNSVLGPAAPSMCCGLNRDGSSIAQTADTCMSNGLCQFQYTEADTKKVITQYWRDGCSSANWTACMPAGACDFVNNGNTQVTPCGATTNTTKWCCGDANSAATCCANWSENSSAFSLPVFFEGALAASASTASLPWSATTATATSPSLTANSSTGAAVATPPTVATNDTAASTTATDPVGHHSSSGPTVIGATLGALVSTGLAAGACFLVWRRRQQRGHAAATTKADTVLPDTVLPDTVLPDAAELGDNNPFHGELPTSAPDGAASGRGRPAVLAPRRATAELPTGAAKTELPADLGGSGGVGGGERAAVM
ncbi:hypothetical protein P8C59_009043 [Phyllachora maydis]|uniref:Uncharacterized protein n=1 Tax=Phyllachora maydis TaxID=1825666 RepID=A0AAD9IBP0_9PEZI|nr:hypothetical protein P8C59_009043 [Phyllachora maydis]